MTTQRLSRDGVLTIAVETKGDIPLIDESGRVVGRAQVCNGRVTATVTEQALVAALTGDRPMPFSIGYRVTIDAAQGPHRVPVQAEILGFREGR